jgi:hypothetical protein
MFTDVRYCWISHNRDIPLSVPTMSDLTANKQYSITLDILCDDEIIYTVATLSNVTLLSVSGYNWADTWERLEWMMLEYGIFIE